MGQGRSVSERKAEVRRRLTLSAVVEAHVKLSGSASSSRRRGKCPFHGSNSPSLALFDADKGTGSGTCFGCQWQGDLFRFLMDIRGVDFMAALEEAEGLAGLASGSAAAGRQGQGPIQRDRNPVAPRRRTAPDRIEPVEMGRWIWRHARRDDAAARRYMLGRGVPEAALTTERLAAFRYLADCPCSPWAVGADPRSEPVAPALVALVCAPSSAGREPSGSLGSSGGPNPSGPPLRAAVRPCVACGSEPCLCGIEWIPLGVHVTYLSPDGEGTMRRRKPWAKDGDPDPMLPKRRMLGSVGGGAVVLGDYRPDAPLWVGEGNETVLSAMGLADAPADGVGIATLSLDNLQGGMRMWANRVWPLFDVRPDPARPCFVIRGHEGPVCGLVDSDMSPLRGVRDRQSGQRAGEAVVERKGGPIVRRAITGAERARICGELFVKGWRGAGVVDVTAVRAPAGMDFNDAAREAQAA